MLKIKHDPKQLVDVIAIPVVFTVLFTYLFGGAISGSPGHYLKTLLPGVSSWASPPSPCTAAPASPRT